MPRIKRTKSRNVIKQNLETQNELYSACQLNACMAVHVQVTKANGKEQRQSATYS